MKKTLFIVGLLFATAFSINAQSISENAIGLRLGDNSGFGGEISYQRALGDNNRLEIDLGLKDNKNYDGFKATGIYQWVWNIDGGFNWYAGVGGGLGNYSGKDSNDNYSDTFIFAAGDIGIEYNFPNAPILLSLDLRPEFGFGDDNFNDYDNDIAFGVRYQF
jgi:hypothetical protein